MAPRHPQAPATRETGSCATRMSSWPQARDRTFRRSSVRDDVIGSGPSRTPPKPGALQARANLFPAQCTDSPAKIRQTQVSEPNTLRTGELVTSQGRASFPCTAPFGCDGYLDRRQGSAGSNSSAVASHRTSARSGRVLTFSARPFSSPRARSVNVAKSLVRDGSESARFRSIVRRDRRWRNRRFIAAGAS